MWGTLDQTSGDRPHSSAGSRCYGFSMDKSYVIYWKSRINGRSGTGTTFFDREEAERLVMELNRDYPEIQHEAREAGLLNGETEVHARE